MQKTIDSFLVLLIVMPVGLFSQPLHQSHEFTRADTLRGTVTPERTWWNVTKYDLEVQFDFNKKSLAGRNIISYEVL